MALPSGKTSKVKSIVTYDGELDYAFPPQSVTLTLEDEIDVSRGEMLYIPITCRLLTVTLKQCWYGWMRSQWI